MTADAGPIFRQIARALSAAIKDGTLPVGGLLPTEIQLSRRYGVSRHTVREALGALRAMGLIESRRGLGTRVVRDTAGATYTEAYSSIEELIRTAKAAPVRPYDVQEVVADAELAQRLRGRAGQSYLRVLAIRRHTEDARPAAHVEVHIDATYAGIAAQLHDLRRSIAETIEDTFGLRIARIEQEISSVALDPAAAAQLGVASGTPALLIRRWYASETGRIFEAASSLYPSGHFSYRNVLLRQGGGPGRRGAQG